MRARRQPPESDPAPSPPDDTARSFEVFFSENYARAVRFAWFLTRSEAAADDVAQDAFLAVHKKFATLDEPAAYLTSVIVNRSHSWHRKNAGQLRLLRTLPHDDTTPDAAADIELLDAVQRLPYRQQVVIVSRYWGGWSEKDIAAALDCAPGTVKSLASRAMQTLRKDITS